MYGNFVLIRLMNGGELCLAADSRCLSLQVFSDDLVTSRRNCCELLNDPYMTEVELLIDLQSRVRVISLHK